MKKNIVLIDLDLTLIKSIYESKKVNIEFLITDADDAQLVKIKDLYDIKYIITRDKFHDYTVQEISNIDYKTIEKFQASQLNSEHYQDRFSDDVNLKQYHYFNALSFWVNVFTKNNISTVILNGLMHGANYDSLALDVAKDHGISGYVVESHMVRHTKDGMVAIRSVLDYNLKERTSLDLCALRLKSIDIDNYLFYADKVSAALKKKRKSIKGIVKFFLPSYAYVIALSLVKIIRNQPICGHGLNSHPANILKNIFYVRKMRRFYDSISVELDTSKKYVFYALHFDPEATIMARARFSNQLMVIKQLSQSLPKGWNLYVKDHPDQFMLYRAGWWFYLISIHKYRTKEFYQEILKLDNVSLLKCKVKSQDVIKSAEAVSTINGSIASESLVFNKSLILFGHQSTPFGLCKDVFKVTSTKQCQEAMNQIENDFTPDYSDFNKIVDNYFFELKVIFPNDVRLLVDHLVCECSSLSEAKINSDELENTPNKKQGTQGNL
jgi:hypothetical protein